MSSQIDHIVISPQGIEVIGTKNYNGKVYGKKDEESWTTHYNKKENYKMQNPLIQNQGHCNAIKNIVGKDIPVQSTIIFTGNADISSVKYSNVYFLEDYNAKCKTFKSIKNEEQHINSKEIYDLLLENKGNVSKRNHIKNRQNNQH